MRNIQPYTIEMAYGLIKNRKTRPSTNSYASQLMTMGTPAIAQKLGEQALETVIAAMQSTPNNTARLAEESADLLYHMLVLWADTGLEPQDIYDLLATRMSMHSTKLKVAS